MYTIEKATDFQFTDKIRNPRVFILIMVSLFKKTLGDGRK